MIVGDSATGKSTVAELFSKKLSIPLASLDQLLFKPDGSKVSDQELALGLMPIIQGDRWIIEGNSFPVLLKDRLEAADCIIFFDYNPWKVLWKVCMRDLRIAFGMKRKGYKAKHNLFHFRYYIPYIFKVFPPRKNFLKRLIADFYKNDLYVIASNKSYKRLLATLEDIN